MQILKVPEWLLDKYSDDNDFVANAGVLSSLWDVKDKVREICEFASEHRKMLESLALLFPESELIVGAIELFDELNSFNDAIDSMPIKEIRDAARNIIGLADLYLQRLERLVKHNRVTGIPADEQTDVIGKIRKSLFGFIREPLTEFIRNLPISMRPQLSREEPEDESDVHDIKAQKIERVNDVMKTARFAEKLVVKYGVDINNQLLSRGIEKKTGVEEKWTKEDVKEIHTIYDNATNSSSGSSIVAFDHAHKDFPWISYMLDLEDHLDAIDNKAEDAWDDMIGIHRTIDELIRYTNRMRPIVAAAINSGEGDDFDRSESERKQMGGTVERIVVDYIARPLYRVGRKIERILALSDVSVDPLPEITKISPGRGREGATYKRVPMKQTPEKTTRLVLFFGQYYDLDKMKDEKGVTLDTMKVFNKIVESDPELAKKLISKFMGCDIHVPQTHAGILSKVKADAHTPGIMNRIHIFMRKNNLKF